MAPLSLETSSSCEDSCVYLAEPQGLAQNASLSSFASATNTGNCSDALVDKSDQSYDAFLYYSNDEVRIRVLKLQEPTDAESTSIEMSRHERKTRLSFELDPLLMMEDMMEELLDDDELSDIDYDKLKCWDGSKMDLLAELLTI